MLKRLCPSPWATEERNPYTQSRWLQLDHKKTRSLGPTEGR